MGDAGQSPQGVFPALCCWVAQAGRPSGVLTSPLLAGPWEQLYLGTRLGVQLLLLPATGARCTGIKGFVLVGKQRCEKGTAPKMAWMDVDFPFKYHSPVERG